MAGDLILDQIPTAEVDFYWPVLAPHFRAGIDAVTTSLTIEEVKEHLKAQRWSAWAIYLRKKPLPIYAAACTNLRKTNSGKVVTISLIGGRDIDVWLPEALAEFEALARKNGCVKIEVEGRRGWERYLTGFKTVRIIMEKAL